ncbi:MAG: bifunctional riboflavin kinase/FAD synthetase [Roseburia sp.]|nr:bifunctional riboflavin kinase/FAD synthetase [Roseburia sp.]
MKYMKKSTDFYIEEPTVVSLGKFDGIHRGHELLMECVAKQKEKGLKTVVFTFDIPPKKQILGEEGKVLTTNLEKVQLFEKLGIDYLIECPFTPEIMHILPEDFIEMLVEKLHMKCLVAGKDFRFGYRRRGDYRLLLEKAEVYGYIPQIVDKMKEDGRDISSTFIREEISAGNIEKANHLLGYPYFIQGEVVHGKSLGSRSLYPTINQVPQPEKILPPFGVYVTRAFVEGKAFGGITNVGIKPTVGGENPVGVETHLFDFRENVYEKTVKVEFLKPVRREMKFDSIEELKEQIKKDIETAKKYYKNITDLC